MIQSIFNVPSTVSLHQAAAAAAFVCTVALLDAAPAVAQMRGTFAVGAAISLTRPTAGELERTVRFSPTLRRLPAKGWGPAFALNWYEAEITDPAIQPDARLGRFVSRPLMAGIGYTAVRGQMSISPSVVAGPALNRIVIDDALRATFSIDGSSFERNIGTASLAVRPNLTVTYALRSRLGVTGGASYMINRPTFTIETPAGVTKTRWNADAFTISGGLVVSPF
jgi:hypothetical protein